MKYFFYYFSIFIAFILPYQSYALIKELNQFQQRLHTLTQFLSKPLIVTSKSTLATYEELKKIVDEAYKTKNSSLLDGYKQTVAVKVAKYLLDELIREGSLPENRPEYIPFMAYVVEKVVEQYPPYKIVSFNCVSLAAGDLENELLLVRALRYVGYRTIQLTAINIKYTAEEKEKFSKKFTDWCNKRNISVALNFKFPLSNTVNLTLFDEVYNYIDNVSENKLPENRLLLMIQPEESMGIGYYKDPVLFKARDNKLIFYESRKSNSPYIKIYFSHEPSNFFIQSNFTAKEDAKNKFKSIIEQSDYVRKKRELEWSRECYLAKLITDLVNENKTNFGIPYIGIGIDLDLLFYDLIAYTALEPEKPLAFKLLGSKMKQLSKISAIMAINFNRYAD